MNIRYANDLLLTDLVRQLNAHHKSFSDHLTDGYLHAANVQVDYMLQKLAAIGYRLNDIRFKNNEA
jgi:hypothetical protein